MELISKDEYEKSFREWGEVVLGKNKEKEMSFGERITQAEKDTEVVGWSIKPDNYSWTLVRKHVGKKGKSAGKVVESTVGWYKSIQSAQSALIDILQRTGMEDVDISPKVAQELIDMKESILNTLNNVEY